MNFYVMTLFPEMIEQGMNTSITGRAIAKGLLSLETVNIRDYSVSGNGRIDDYPYGGGAGMVMQAEPIYRAFKELLEKIQDSKIQNLNIQDSKNQDLKNYDSIGGEPVQIQGEGGPGLTQDSGAPGLKQDSGEPGRTQDGRTPRVIYLTPQGQVFHQAMARELAEEESLIFLCGHYEGVDERVLDEIVTDQVSIGDYVLTGGELPAMVMMDAIARMVPGVLSNEQSGESESFSDGLLEYPQYSRPEIWHERAVPPVLLSGHHGNVDRWRRDQSLLRTLLIRPELLDGIALDKGDRKFLLQLLNGEAGIPLSEEQAVCLQKILI
ncbi:MAG: tRNA (guanosine(37)-N1)-methyltransferase TrmD [Lachnospiraceae bacterium]|nr:tRNA (guanosine(37)-N1)-methyltransferase TrmD [Lachnospiraceae bacterium]